ncbi:MAG: hypothetical protein RR477_00840, partial [Raoultibacter sp.]
EESSVVAAAVDTCCGAFSPAANAGKGKPARGVNAKAAASTSAIPLLGFLTFFIFFSLLSLFHNCMSLAYP